MKNVRLFKFAILLLTNIILSKNLLCQNNDSLKKFDRVKVGDPCPQFTLNSSSNMEKQELTSSELKGSVTLINFFATWCNPCLNELPAIENKIWNKYKDNKNFKLILIARGQSEKTIENFKNKKGYSFQMFADSTRLVYEKFAEKYIPRTYIINKDGIIVYSGINYNTYDFNLMLGKLEELLK